MSKGRHWVLVVRLRLPSSRRVHPPLNFLFFLGPALR